MLWILSHLCFADVLQMLLLPNCRCLAWKCYVLSVSQIIIGQSLGCILKHFILEGRTCVVRLCVSVSVRLCVLYIQWSVGGAWKSPPSGPTKNSLTSADVGGAMLFKIAQVLWKPARQSLAMAPVPPRPQRGALGPLPLRPQRRALSLNRKRAGQNLLLLNL